MAIDIQKPLILFNIGASDFVLFSSDEGLYVGAINESPPSPSRNNKSVLLSPGASVLCVHSEATYLASMLYIVFGHKCLNVPCELRLRGHCQTT